MTCASRLCLRSLTFLSKLPDVELCWSQLRQVPELLYKKGHGSSPAVVQHHKYSCSYIATAATKYGTRQQSSSVIGPQLQLPAVATGSYSKGLQLPSLPPPPSPAFPRRHLRAQRGECNMGRPWGIVVIMPGECRQTPRFASTTRDHSQLATCTSETDAASATATGFTATVGVARGHHHHHEGGETTELFYQWACAAPRVTPGSVTPITGAGHGTSRWQV